MGDSDNDSVIEGEALSSDYDSEEIAETRALAKHMLRKKERQ